MIEKILSKLTVPAFLVVSTSIGFFGLISMLYKWPISGDSKDILQVMLGTVGAGWLLTMNYYFSSSSGSAKKTDALIKKGDSTQ